MKGAHEGCKQHGRVWLSFRKALALGGPFPPSLAYIDLGQAVLPCRASISSTQSPFFNYARLASSYGAWIENPLSCGCSYSRVSA